ncbi:MAG: DUF2971 domain-containing protein [Methylococcales bacterium]|nr:DUF2971 domain-containing protein [Methylococcales bacterium]MDP3840421.1 DUF2971 domain-containing protein [Methylococcales bacterium]
MINAPHFYIKYYGYAMTKEIQDNLYHYTDHAGLFGILENNCLWATHYKFLNDDTELTAAKEKLKNSLLKSDSKLNKEYKDLFSKNNYEVFDNYYNKFEEKEFYITSLCKSPTGKGIAKQHIAENGLLSQWRGYSDNGGFAIEFKEKELMEFITKEYELEKNNQKSIIFLSRVVYSDEDYSKKFKESINTIIEEINGKTNIEKLRQSWIKCIASYKSVGFKEENEFRIISYLDKTSKKIRQFRGKNGDIPYIEFFKDACSNSGINLPIERIIVGPHKDKEARAAHLRVKLAIMGRDIPVTISKTPFIGR